MKVSLTVKWESGTLLGKWSRKIEFLRTRCENRISGVVLDK
ncbi:unnamed protein product [Haemonchus placei]|uniref:Uncharacterized protein n=1 Tax=Haemonchus placei TaxID=6290 RepID=A0A0N4X7U6_HAEPC|nr:unnamed protein product [Haemonchus placei]